MCIQCAAGAMTAVAASSGSRLWLEASLPGLFGERGRKVVRGALVTAGVLAAGVVGPSVGGATASGTAAPAAQVAPAATPAP
jgi:hypothetical protein